ncbi:MAG: hypothetical protein GY943_28965 [Chloroflexi bacterium]|nr:hypothetical protein [Chloroflexota bacterium]
MKQHIIKFYLTLLFLALVFLIGIRGFNTLQASTTEDTFAYLPIVQNGSEPPISPTPDPIPVERPSIHTTTLAIESYNLDKRGNDSLHR